MLFNSFKSYVSELYAYIVFKIFILPPTRTQGNGSVETVLSKIAPTWNDYYVGRGTADELYDGW